MAEKIQVTVTYEDVFDVTIEFDDNEATNKICHEINNFWSNSDSRLKVAKNCIYQCVTNMIAKEIIRLQMKTSFYCGEDAAIKAFDDGIEGFYPIDGSYGIKLKYCDDFELNYLSVDFNKKVVS